jgi:NAD(P)-dependent dehydrogenase (short-subunit alcohol dehydrogenase family)
MAIAFITGSGRRIGKGLAIEFARKGWDVLIHYNNSADTAQKTFNEIKNMGAKAAMFQADVRDLSAMKNGFDQAVSEIGHPDVLVNNAAIYPSANNLQDTDESLWDDVMDINLKSYFQISKMFSENAEKGSRIINIASLGAFQIWKGRIPYNVSKAGVIQLTKALARDLAPKISVNSVSPGSIEIENEPAEGGLALKAENIPMNRYGKICDVFDAVYFFATASLYITGQNLNVDGGYHL